MVVRALGVMFTIPELTANALGSHLAERMRLRFGSTDAALIERVYTSPADLIDLYPKFYWTSVAPHIQSAIRYLNVTSNGRRWIANLYSNIFRAERELSLSRPQR